MEPLSFMTRAAAWLLDLDQIRLGKDAPLSVFWRGEMPLWTLFPLAVLLAFVVTATYRRERGSRFCRTLLCGIRVALIALVIAMIHQPVLKLQRDRIEPSRVALLIDRSQSMTVRDHAADRTKPGGNRIDNLRAALLNEDASALSALMRRNELELYTFGGTVTREATADTPEALSSVVAALKRISCDAAVTNVPDALQEVLRRTEGGRLAAIVLASDGRTTEPASLGRAIAAAKARQVPVFPILIGSPVPRRDVYVSSVSIEENVFLKDYAAVRVQIGVTGLERSAGRFQGFEGSRGQGVKESTEGLAPHPRTLGPLDPRTPDTEITVRLIRENGDVLVATRTIVLSAQEQSQSTPEIELFVKPDRPGRIDYRVEIVPLEGELETDNNVARVRINVIDDQLRVLYCEGYPRYEYRYLKNALLREPTIRSSCLLLSADPGFAQEGTDPIRRFPESLDELSNYDVVLFGDVDPNGAWITPRQIDMLVEFVAERGGGFGLIAGPRYAPHAYRGTPMEKLLPIRIDPEWHGSFSTALDTLIQPELTLEGRHHRIFRFAGHRPQSATPPTESVERQSVSLRGLYWMAHTQGPKPGAQVLAEDHRAQGPSGPMPLYVLGRYGAGRVFFSATDDTWRWRATQGEWMLDTFWLQVCRTLMRAPTIGTDHRVTLRTNRPRYRYGERVELHVEILDAELLASLGSDIHALVLDDALRGGNSLRAGDSHTPVLRVALSQLGEASNQYEGAFVPPHAGSFVVELDEVAPPTLGGQGWGTAHRRASAMIRVAEADRELRRPEADHKTLRRLAAETGGMIMNMDYPLRGGDIAEKADAILDRSVRIPDDLSEPLWDSKLVLALFVLMIGTEWLLRRAYGML